MTGRPSPTAYVPAAFTVRSGFPESLHHVALVALDAHGDVAFALGDSRVEVFPRSSLKPLQATAMVEAGLDLPPHLLALVCASHDGRPEHLAAARAILATVGLDDAALMNTPDLPLDTDAAEAVLRAGGARTPLQMNCSGKHSGMVVTARVNGWDVDRYIDADHPVQRRIVEGMTRLVGAPPDHEGVDGCGAPAHAIGLLSLARAFASMASGRAGDAGRAVHTAMTAHPAMVGGPRRDVTLMMQGVPGLMAKDGAEGVFAAALPDGRAVALKVADGTNRARPVLMTAALAHLGVDVSGIDPAVWVAPILGHGQPVGEVRLLGELADSLAEATGRVPH